jgi:hypothetical protein
VWSTSNILKRLSIRGDPSLTMAKSRSRDKWTVSMLKLNKRIDHTRTCRKRVLNSLLAIAEPIVKEEVL